MFKTNILKKKSGQIGDTLTWTVATIAILGIILFSIFVLNGSNLFGENKLKYSETFDIPLQNSVFAYMNSPDGDRTVFDRFYADEDFSESSGELAVQIFDKSMKKSFSKSWAGFSEKGNSGREPVENKFFGNPLKLIEISSSIAGVNMWLKGNKIFGVYLSK